MTKKSHVTIKNKDQLCCARAIVTIKALVDANRDPWDQDYHNLKQGCPVQGRKAKKLHRLADVSEGPCGIPKLQKFQEALLGYQLKVKSIDSPHMIIYAGPVPCDKIIRLIKEDGDYDRCNWFKGFLDTSRFCDECNRGYDQDDYKNHPSDSKWCPPCKQWDCLDFLEAKEPLSRGQCPKPHEPCALFHHRFLGDRCYNYHNTFKVSRLLSHLQTRQKSMPPQQSSSTGAWVQLGRMQHLWKEGQTRHTPMLHPTYPGRGRRSQNETRATQWSGNSTFHRTRLRRSRYMSLRRKRSTSPSVLRLQSHHRRQGQLDLHSSLLRRGRVQRHHFLLRSQLHH